MEVEFQFSTRILEVDYQISRKRDGAMEHKTFRFDSKWKDRLWLKRNKNIIMRPKRSYCIRARIISVARGKPSNAYGDGECMDWEFGD